MITTLPPAPVAASAAEAPACINCALPPSTAATIRVLPPTRMSSTSSPSAVKYPASLAIQVVAQLAAKLGYKRRLCFYDCPEPQAPTSRLSGIRALVYKLVYDDSGGIRRENQRESCEIV